MRVMAAITDPSSIRRYLEGTGQSATIPEIAPARARRRKNSSSTYERTSRLSLVHNSSELQFCTNGRLLTHRLLRYDLPSGNGSVRPFGEVVHVGGIFSLRTNQRLAAKSPHSHFGKQDNTPPFLLSTEK